jgi:hypothetical protein
VPATPYRTAAVAVILVAVGMFCCGMYRVLSQNEHHAYASGSPPRTVQLTAGSQYILSVRGGTKSLLDRGVDVASPNCTWSVGGAEPQALTVTPARSGAKGTNAVATFVAPFTGDLHLECKDFGGVYVDDADNSKSDTAGWYLFGGVVALTVGAGLALSVLRLAWFGRSGRRASREHDELEGLIDVPVGGLRYDEIGRLHRDDIST